jgi:hypothetical protein
MFVVDRYGDRDQLRYGIEQSKIPAFNKLYRSSYNERQNVSVYQVYFEVEN